MPSVDATVLTRHHHKEYLQWIRNWKTQESICWQGWQEGEGKDSYFSGSYYPFQHYSSLLHVHARDANTVLGYYILLHKLFIQFKGSQTEPWKDQLFKLVSVIHRHSFTEGQITCTPIYSHTTP
jgi:hypothetical protein